MVRYSCGIAYADPESINGLNLYAYCGNNPVMNVDPDGTAWRFFLIAFAIGFAISFALSAISQAVTNDGKINLQSNQTDYYLIKYKKKGSVND